MAQAFRAPMHAPLGPSAPRFGDAPYASAPLSMLVDVGGPIAAIVDSDLYEASAQNITPIAAVATGTAAAPSAGLGALGVTPSSAVAASAGAAPSVGFGSLGVTPTPSVAATFGASPSIAFGAIGATPVNGHAVASGAAPVIDLGPLAVAPSPASSSTNGTEVDVDLGPIGVSPVPATAIARAEHPDAVIPVPPVRPWTWHRARLARRARRLHYPRPKPPRR